jgi:uncharacterized protein (TIRG00374 family)
VDLAKKLIRLSGPVLFLFILARIELSRTAELLSAIDLQVLLAVLALYPFLILLKTWRWRMLLRQQGVNYGLIPAFAVYNSSLAVGYVTPGRLGEFVKALFLRTDTGVTLGRAFSSVLLDRLLDLYLLLVTAAVCALLFAVPQRLLGMSLTILLAGALGPLVIFVPAVNRRLVALAARASAHFTPAKYEEDVARSLDDFQRGLEELLTAKLFTSLLLTILAYAVFYLQCYLLALALGFPLSYAYAAYSVSLASLLALLPVSISGLGVRDAAFIALLQPVGLTTEMAVSYSLLTLVVFNVFGGAIGAIAWIVKPLR